MHLFVSCSWCMIIIWYMLVSMLYILLFIVWFLDKFYCCVTWQMLVSFQELNSWGNFQYLKVFKNILKHVRHAQGEAIKFVWALNPVSIKNLQTILLCLKERWIIINCSFVIGRIHYLFLGTLKKKIKSVFELKKKSVLKFLKKNQINH